MDKITEALKKILPPEHVEEVAKSIQDLMGEAVDEIKADYQEKINEVYETLSEENKVNEGIAIQGYKQAQEIVADLMMQQVDAEAGFHEKMQKEFAEAYAELEKEKAKNNEIEIELYDEFDKKRNV